MNFKERVRGYLSEVVLLKKKDRQCNVCKKIKVDVEEREDPYAKEVNNKPIMRLMCKKCYRDRLDEI